MAVSEEYLEYVLDQMSGVGEVVPRKMFGGVGLYLEGVFFGLIADDVLYFKVDETNKKEYEERGTGPFRPFEDKETYAMSYYEVPIEVLENREETAA